MFFMVHSLCIGSSHYFHGRMKHFLKFFMFLLRPVVRIYISIKILSLPLHEFGHNYATCVLTKGSFLALPQEDFSISWTSSYQLFKTFILRMKKYKSMTVVSIGMTILSTFYWRRSVKWNLCS